MINALKRAIENNYINQQIYTKLWAPSIGLEEDEASIETGDDGRIFVSESIEQADGGVDRHLHAIYGSIESFLEDCIRGNEFLLASSMVGDTWTNGNGEQFTVDMGFAMYTVSWFVEYITRFREDINDVCFSHGDIKIDMSYVNDDGDLIYESRWFGEADFKMSDTAGTRIVKYLLNRFGIDTH